MQNVVYFLTGVMATVSILIMWQYYAVLPLSFLDRLRCKIYQKKSTAQDKKIVRQAEERDERKREETAADFSAWGIKRTLLVILFLFFLIEGFTLYIGHLQTAWYVKIKLELILVLLTAVAWIDQWKKIIPNVLVAGTIGIRALLAVGEYMYAESDFQKIVILDVLGFIFGFGVLLFVAVISKQSLGYGDVKLFAAIGLTLGVAGTYNTLFYAMIFTLIAALYLLLIKKKERKYKFPFGPYIYLGYLSVLVFQVF